MGTVPAAMEQMFLPPGQEALNPHDLTSVAVVWKDDVARGEVELTYAQPQSPVHFVLHPGVKRLTIQIGNIHVGPGAFATRVTIRYLPAGKKSIPTGFTFFLRDLQPDTTILIRGLQVAVVSATDARTYEQVETAVNAKKLASDRTKIDMAQEDDYESACRETKSMRCQTWLGLGRDMRIFRVMPRDSAGYWGYIEPCDLRKSSLPQEGPDSGQYSFILGRGAGCKVDLERRLEDGILPILRSVQHDDEVEYRLTILSTLEKEPLTLDRVRGTHWLAAFANSAGAMLTEQETKEYEAMKAAEVIQREQELICWVHIEAVNRGRSHAMPMPKLATLRPMCSRVSARRDSSMASGFRKMAASSRLAALVASPCRRKRCPCFCNQGQQPF